MTNYSSSTVEQEGSPVRETLEEKTTEVSDQVSDQARRAKSSVRDQLRRQVDDRSTAAGEQVMAMSQAMTDMGSQLRQRGSPMPARVTEEAAVRADRLGRYLRDSNGGQILNDVEGFGRRQPWLVAALGVAVGLATARFLKASNRNGPRSSRPSA